jgi:hypothetical protein
VKCQQARCPKEPITTASSAICTPGAFARNRPARDPDLRLQVGPHIITPRLIAGQLHRFAIPAGATSATILSNAAIPAEITAAADHRRLGVMVEHIILRRPNWRHELRLDRLPEGQGWHAPENHGPRHWRWTNGKARLDLPARTDAILLLDLRIGAAQPAWRHPPAANAAKVRDSPIPSVTAISA